MEQLFKKVESSHPQLMSSLFIGIDMIGLISFGYALASHAITNLLNSSLALIWISILLIAQLIFFTFIYRQFFSSNALQLIQQFHAKHRIGYGIFWFFALIYSFLQTAVALMFVFANDVFIDSKISVATVYFPLVCITGSAIAIGIMFAVYNQYEYRKPFPFWLYGISAMIFPVPTFLLAISAVPETQTPPSTPLSNQSSGIISLAFNAIVLNIMVIEFAVARTIEQQTLLGTLERVLSVLLFVYIPYYIFMQWVVRPHSTWMRYFWPMIYVGAQLTLISLYV